MSQIENDAATAHQTAQGAGQAVSPATSGSSAPAEAAPPVAVIPGNGRPPQLDRAPLAYENKSFLDSPDGRLIRIVA